MVLKNEKDTKHQKELNNLEAMFKRATIPLLVLQMLSEREMYAYEIIQEVTSLTGGTYKMPLLTRKSESVWIPTFAAISSAI